MKFLILVLAVLVSGARAQAPTGGKSDLFPSQQIRAQLTTLGAEAATSGSSGRTLADYGSHKLQLSVRTSSGGAEIHAHFDDVMIVEQGSATLITGGSLINPTTSSDGETKGSAIQGGNSQTISVGDIITVNAGVPHQLLIPTGTIYSALVIKVKE
jgi:mannose-6-phosphate isomerase-like protein (cupin superfamily)